MALEYDVPAEECEAAVDAFVDRLREQGLVDTFAAPDDGSPLRRRYLDLLSRALVNLHHPEYDLRLAHLSRQGTSGDELADARLLRDIRYRQPEAFADVVERRHRPDYTHPQVAYDAHTLIGLARLQHLERCAARVFADGVQGDFLEAGVCQGGAAIFLRAVQVAYGEPGRRTWVADSFAGVPPPAHPVDVEHGADYSAEQQPWLAIPRRAVEDHFRTYGLLSERVRFLEGLFADTLPQAPVERLSILRVDGDMYESTRDALEAMHDRVAAGGYVIVDDYGFAPCRAAVDEFLAAAGLADDLRFLDDEAVYWRVRG